MRTGDGMLLGVLCGVLMGGWWWGAQRSRPMWLRLRVKALMVDGHGNTRSITVPLMDPCHAPLFQDIGATHYHLAGPTLLKSAAGEEALTDDEERIVVYEEIAREHKGATS